ncbi:MAG: hypothetical protein H6Q73_3446, partial [Firmicutes bacterium]|nr:hypothetical protein [Bacillota bacterium]
MATYRDEDWDAPDIEENYYDDDDMESDERQCSP